MSKPILCLDFDGVIHSYTSGWKGATRIPDPPVEGAFQFIIEAMLQGWDVVIHSSRCRHIFGPMAIRAWLKEHGGLLYPSTMGYGLEDVRIARLKPSAVITIDDRGMTFDGIWPDLAALKKFKPWNKRPQVVASGDAA